MGSRAERRARREAKIAEHKKAFTQALIDNPKVDVDKPISEIRHAIADTMEACFLKLRKKHPPQDAALIREAMNQYVAEMTGRREVGKD
jgi:hypothetical protein